MEIENIEDVYRRASLNCSVLRYDVVPGECWHLEYIGVNFLHSIESEKAYFAIGR